MHCFSPILNRVSLLGVLYCGSIFSHNKSNVKYYNIKIARDVRICKNKLKNNPVLRNNKTNLFKEQPHTKEYIDAI